MSTTQTADPAQGKLAFLDSALGPLGDDEQSEPQQPPKEPAEEPAPPPPPPAPIDKPEPTTPPAARPALRQDTGGNLIDAAGNIVVQAGAARRLHSRMQKLEADLNTHRTRADTLAQTYEQLPKTLGMTPAEAEFGMRFAAAFKNDPVGAAKWLVQQAVSRGHDISKIVGEQGSNIPAINADAIKQMIQSALQPISDRFKQQEQAETVDAAATREYEAFLANHDHANMHEDVIAVMMDQDPSATASSCYWRLRHWMQEQGLDYRKPIASQLTRDTGTAPGKPGQPTSMPRGSDGSTVALNTSTSDFGLPTREDIVRRAMTEAGFNI